MKNLAFCRSLVLGAVLAATSTPLLSQKAVTESISSAFVEGGEINIQLSAGDHKILARDDNQIRIRWSVREQDRDKKVAANATVDGLTAKIDLDGPSNNFRTVIEVPRKSDLTIRLTAGELSVGRIMGDKDIRLRAGDLSIEVGDGADYRLAEGSVWAGDIDAGPFNRETGGLFRSLDWRGDGTYDLRFHLYAGDVKIY